MLLKKVCSLAVSSVVANGVIVSTIIKFKENESEEEIKQTQKREPQWEKWAEGLNGVTGKYNKEEMERDDHEANML